MFPAFLKYFTIYIFRAKTRQKLLFLAVLGLFISSFALLVLQSTMGGLQHKLIGRSKAVSGHGVIIPHFDDEVGVFEIVKLLQKSGFRVTPEYEAEVLLKSGQYLAPVIVHAIDPKGYVPNFLEGRDFSELVLPRDLSIKLGVETGELLKMISPAHVNSFLGDIPRTVSLYVDFLTSTDVPEIDQYHVWVELKKMQNLIRARSLNKIRLYEAFKLDALKDVLDRDYEGKYRIITWEEMNKTLVWALKLESTVMIFLFIGMTLLVGLCITSGLMIFLDKIKTDLASFWILGCSEKALGKSADLFLQVVGIVSIFSGIGAALLFLWFLDQYGTEIMPDVFVDRKIPVHIESGGLLISFLVPYVMSTLFGKLTLNLFKKDTDYLEQVRSANA